MSLSELKTDHLSPSSIATYLDSPMRWRDRYLHGKGDGYSLSLHRGLVVHDVLEGLITSPNPDYDVAHAILVADELRRMSNPGFTEPLNIPETAALVSEYWHNYGSNLEIVSAEWPFSIDLPYAQHLRSLIGRIDVVHKLEDGAYAILDFKTGARKRSWADVANDPQAIIYGMAARDLLGVEGIVDFQYHQLIFKSIPEIVVLNRPVHPYEMEEFENDFLPGIVKTIEWQVENDAWFFNPHARFGKRIQ